MRHKAVEAVQAKKAMRTRLGDVIRVCNMLVASCGAPASQTHNSAVAGSDHESYPKYARQNGVWFMGKRG